MKKDIYKLAIKTYGMDAQLGMAQEECAELIVAINKLKRDKCTANHINFCEEVADVEIMLEQMRICFDNILINKIKRQKINRLKKRLSQ